MSQTQHIINKFGSQAKLARALGFIPTRIQGWKESGTIPPWHYNRILEIAREEDIDLSWDDFRVPEDVA